MNALLETMNLPRNAVYQENFGIMVTNTIGTIGPESRTVQNNEKTDWVCNALITSDLAAEVHEVLACFHKRGGFPIPHITQLPPFL